MSDLIMNVAASAPRPGALHSFGLALDAAWLMLQRSRERRVLAGLDARELCDIGVTAYEAGVEARKPFWKG